MLLANRLERLLRFGTLTVIDASGTYRTFGDGMEPAVTIRLADRHLPLAFLVDAELALPEAYMDGRLTIERGGLHTLLELMLRNLRHRDPVAGFGLRANLRSLVRSMRRRNPIGRAQANVAHHYDLSDELYRLFLDTERAYSCAFFETGREDLETAQRAKERRIAAKLLLRPGMRVLDIGSGWGALTRHLCDLSGRQIELTGITLSREQHAYAIRRAEAAGLADRLSYQLADYRRVQGRFDRIVSVGMFEHVGAPHYGEFFRRLRALLTDDGVALVHSIGRAHGPYATMPFIRKYIFPGGYIPALSEVLPAIERARLWVTDLEVLRLHYAKTLRCWRERLAAHRAEVEALYDARFYRMWEFYLVASELFFSHEDGMVFQIQLSADRNAVPLTRDYLLPSPPPANRNLAAGAPCELDRAS